jgi:hypothetical protein
MSYTKGIVSHLTSKSIQTYTIEVLSSVFDSQGISYKRVGREINADIDRTGHYSYKINPQKGVYLNTGGGKNGTLAGLLKKLKANTSDIPTTQVDHSSDSHDKKREIARIINDSRPFNEINDAARSAIEKYFAGRGLLLNLPETARVAVVPQGYDLIVPLFSGEDVTAVHITCITKSGEKRPQGWLEGKKHRYTKGNLKNSSGHYVFNSLPGAEEQLSIDNRRWIGIGEGLETTVGGRALSGWSSIFAINAEGLKYFFDNPKNIELFKKTQAGLAIFVDRDLSETGQKGSAYLAQRAKEAGIPVLFLVPPSIIKGGKKGADWDDAVLELGIDGARAALMLAISRSEEELSKIEVGKIVPLENVRDSDTAPVSVERIPVEQAFLETRSLIKDFLDNKQTAPTLLQIDMGVGKSHALSDLSKDHQYVGDPVVTITPTKALAQEAADKSGGLFREGRSDDQSRAGFCFIYPEIEPYSDKMRSIVAHKCHDCVHGLAAMAVSRNETPETDPCSYILHTQDARQAQVLSTTASMLEGDPNIGSVKIGNSVIKSKMILDDTAELSDHRSIHGGHVAEWIRAANHSIRFDQARIDSGDSTDKGEDRKERIEATKKVISYLKALSRFLSDNPGEEQVMVDKEAWTEFSKLIKSSKLKWMDGTSAEAIYKDSEGKTEIPLRTLKALGEALGKGTTWVRKSVLHFSCLTKAFQAIQNRALVLDATASIAVRAVIEACGGSIAEIRAKQEALTTRLVVSGNHGKTACSIDSPSYDREKLHFMNSVKSLEKEVGAEGLAVLSHKSFVETLGEDLEGIDAGHWGMHERGHNEWKEKKALLIWGVPQLSPSTSERHYMSDRQAVIEAGGPEWPIWDGTRTERWYQIPGQKKELFAAGYQNDFIDFWAREWVTAKLKQAEGRLRAARRSGEDLQVIIHASFPFTESFGLEFTSVERPDWRTRTDYQTGRKQEQIEKGIIAFHATGEGSRREANDFLKSIGLKGFSNNDWAEIKEESAGLQHEYSLYVSKTTPDLFGKDIHVLVEAMGKLADFAKEEGVTIEELIGSGLVEASYEERIAMLVLEKALNRDHVKEKPSRTLTA